MRKEKQIELFIKNFISPSRADRYLELLAGNAKQRDKVSIFTDPPDFIHDRCRDITDEVKGKKDDVKVEHILRRLVALGASDECILWSQGTSVDNVAAMPLADAIKVVVDLSPQFVAAIIMCIPGRLALYQGEWADDCCILENN